jgi:hypothetical protein
MVAKQAKEQIQTFRGEEVRSRNMRGEIRVMAGFLGHFGEYVNVLTELQQRPDDVENLPVISCPASISQIEPGSFP